MLTGHAAGVHQQVLLPMQRQVTKHRTDDADVIGHSGDVREQVADPKAALAPLPEFPRAGEPHPIRVRVQRVGRVFADFLTFVLFQHRLGIEGVDMTGTAVHETKDDATDSRRKVRLG